MRFFKRFLKNLWNCILLCITIGIGTVAGIAPLFLVANNPWWLFIYVVYFIIIFSYWATLEDMKKDER